MNSLHLQHLCRLPAPYREENDLSAFLPTTIPALHLVTASNPVRLCDAFHLPVSFDLPIVFPILSFAFGVQFLSIDCALILLCEFVPITAFFLQAVVFVPAVQVPPLYSSDLFLFLKILILYPLLLSV